MISEGSFQDLGNERGAGHVATVETRYAHIVLEDTGVPHIAGTTMKVVELVTAHQAYGWGPEELAVNFPYLTRGQIYSALAYYWDHQAELDADIARRAALADELQRNAPPHPLLTRLRGQRTS
jgi:uncharacterized protein (DUF433 family)